MARDAPERLLQLGCCEQKPTVDLRALFEAGGQQALVSIFFGQVEHDRHRLGEHQVAVDEYRDFPSGIDLEELGTLMLGGQKVDADGLEIHAQLLERPAHADRSGRAELVEFHLHR